MRLALVGCGAVSELFYAPACRQIPSHSIEWFVDTNIQRARQVANIYGHGKATTEYKETIDGVDGAIVAVPNFLHSKVSIDFLNEGRDVLCEKPLATNVSDGMKMVEASRESGARLSVNFIRRRFESYRLARDILNREIIGSLRSITAEEGMALNWPFASSFMLRKDKAGGGVLLDWGSHILDIIQWIFGCDLSVLSYKDDGYGRVEGDCEAELTLDTKTRQIPCTMRLSRSRTLRNSLLVEGDKGAVEIRGDGLHRAYLRFGESIGSIESAQQQNPKSREEHFADQMRAFLDGKPSIDLATGNDGLRNLMVMDECYRKRQDISYPWEEIGASDIGASIGARYRKILVVGASGFLGTRLVQRLALDLGASVRVAVHRPERAARLGRFPVEFVDCDVLEMSQVMQCMNGCDVVVNCARDRSGSKVLDVFTQGTKNLLEAGAKQRVKKFVHISSAAVHGFGQNSEFTYETSSLVSSSRNPYVKGKLRSEELVMEYAREIPVVILRPTLIYGPFSSDWVGGILERLRNESITLVGDSKIANLVYVDDVVDSILLAIERNEANGQVFIVNSDRERVLWKDYVQEYSNILGIPPKAIPGGGRIAFNLAQHRSLLRDSVTALRSLLSSSELLALLAQIPIVVVTGAKLIRGERRKRIESRLTLDQQIRRPDARLLSKYQTIDAGLYEVFACTTVFSSSKAESILGFSPRTSFREGMNKTKSWIEWARLDSSGH